MALHPLKTLASLAVLALAGTASAGTSPFTMISGASSPFVDVSLTIEASTQPGYAYDFVVSNNSASGIVTGVYFEEDWTRKLSGAGLSTGPAELNAASHSPAIPGWEGPKVSHTVGTERVREWFGRAYRDVYYDKLEDGIAPGEIQRFSFMTDTNIVSLNDLVNAVGGSGYGVAIRVQNHTQDPYAAGWGLVESMDPIEDIQDPNPPKVTGAPSPTAAFSGLALLGLAATRRRRR